MMKKKEVNTEELLQFIWFVAGPINPGTHNLYFNSTDISPNPFDNYYEFQVQARQQFLAHHTPVKAIQELMSSSHNLEDEVQSEIIELLRRIVSTAPKSVHFNENLFAFNDYHELRLKVLQIVDYPKFKVKVMDVLNANRSPLELSNILELVEDLEDDIFYKVTSKLLNDPSLNRTDAILMEAQNLVNVRIRLNPKHKL